MKASNKIDYTGKVVYVGIDVHKKTFAVSCICEGVLVKKASLRAENKLLGDFLLKYFKGAQIKSAYEAGFSGFGLHRYLVSQGIENIVINAASIEVSSRDKVKTDKRDSLKLATQLSAHRLKGIAIPSEKEEQERVISRTRSSLCALRRSLGQQIKSKLYQFGLIEVDDTRPMSAKWLKEIERMALAPGLKKGLASLIKLWRACVAEVKALEQLIEEEHKTRARDVMYKSAPGIGVLTARILADELGDLQQFANEKQLFSFTGLTPTERSSGERVRRGGISRQGRGRIRGILVEAAWVAIRKDKALKQFFEKLSARRGKCCSIVAVARKLIGRLRACFANGQLYQLCHAGS